MSPSSYKMMEGGAHPPRSSAEAAGSLVPFGPGPPKHRPGDLGRAALTSADCARLLPTSLGNTAWRRVRRPAGKSGP